MKNDTVDNDDGDDDNNYDSVPAPPALAIANGFAVGLLPAPLRDVTVHEAALVAPSIVSAERVSCAAGQEDPHDQAQQESHGQALAVSARANQRHHRPQGARPVDGSRHHHQVARPEDGLDDGLSIYYDF